MRGNANGKNPVTRCRPAVDLESIQRISQALELQEVVFGQMFCLHTNLTAYPDFRPNPGFEILTGRLP